jgi:RNA polymerase sigma-70 factor (ECF subfamily)
LKEELTRRDKKNLFTILSVYLIRDEGAVPYQEAAVKLDMSEGAVKGAVYRLRRRYRELLREEIAQTVTTEEQVGEEISDLFAAVAR